MSDFYKDFPTAEFKTSLNKASDVLNQMGNGAQAGEAYDAVVQRLWVLANHRQLTRFDFEAHGQVRYAVAALVQERGEVVGGDDLLTRLIKNSRFEALMAELLAFEQEGFDTNNAHQQLTPKLLNLYYQRYFSFEVGIANEVVRSALFKPLKRMLDLYDGLNHMTILAKGNAPLLDGRLDEVLRGFDDLKPLDEIRSVLILSNNHEIFDRLRLLRMLANIRALPANQYDAQVKQLFSDVKQYQHVWANTKRLILEECVREMLLKCQATHDVGTRWQQFIFETIGDPRASKNTQAWLRVGNDLHLWYRGILSRGDLREFLETMTDGQGDAIYQYRKQFWLQYVDYANNAKIMLGRTALERLRRQSPDMYQRFFDSPETYSRLNEAERSCVYVDFGKFCVIEATHSGKWRVYKSSPINLVKEVYNYQEFHNEHAISLMIEEYAHHHPVEYSWQNKVRVMLNQWITPSITLEAILLDSDKTEQRIAQIRNGLWRRNQNPY
jgi:EH_Signature domain